MSGGKRIEIPELVTPVAYAGSPTRLRLTEDGKVVDETGKELPTRPLAELLTARPEPRDETKGGRKVSTRDDYLAHSFIAESLRAFPDAPAGTPLADIFKPFSYFFPAMGRSTDEVEGVIGALWHGTFTWAFGTLITEDGLVKAIHLAAPVPGPWDETKEGDNG